MKITKITKEHSAFQINVMDTYVDSGYIQGSGGQLPDVDEDFQSDRRQEVKEYIEQRYNHDGKQRVFSAGTFTTLKMKAAIKDVCRVHRVPIGIVNYITAIFDDKSSWSEAFQLAYENEKVKKFIIAHPDVFEEIRTLMNQPRSSSVHASALIVTPDDKDGEDMECFDFLPIKKVDGILVSEIDGYSIDEIGLLKNDVLGIKELSKLQQMFEICNREYNANVSLENIVTRNLDDPKVYELLQNGYTQNVFQFSSKGMTKFLKSMKPTCIGDLIAANALFRPATLDSGAAQKYVDCKLGDVAPQYLWGTYHALKETYAQMIYQESMAQIAREVGGFSLGEGVKLVKLISKKKTDKIKALGVKFKEGALKQGCPREDADLIWDMIEKGGSYLFNKCIRGTETIYRGHGGKWQPTIAEMYKIRNDINYARKTGHLPLHTEYISYGYGAGFSLEDSDEFRLVENKIKDIRYMGIRKIYRITLTNGATLDVTDNHKHPTSRGELMTSEIIPEKDYMFINTGREYGNKRLSTSMSMVVSVEYVCDDEVYDVEMDSPFHSFTTANGIVTCNSHATAYAITAYVGAYIKANYPSAFYTVSLEWADQDDVSGIMSEMEQCSKARVLPPDINESGIQFHTDYKTNSIYWSLVKIKMVGVNAVSWIIDERDSHGPYTSIENFIERVFKYKLKKYQYWDDPDNEDEMKRCPVNARHVLNLILSGCFDNIEGAKSNIERYAIVKKAAKTLGFEIKKSDFPEYLVEKHYFWGQKQIQVSGIGKIDYKRAFDNSSVRQNFKGKMSYRSLEEIADDCMDGKKVGFCATVIDIEEKKFKDKKTGEDKIFCRMNVLQDNNICELVAWTEEYSKFRPDIIKCKDKLISAVALVKYSNFSERNTLQFINTSIMEIL